MQICLENFLTCTALMHLWTARVPLIYFNDDAYRLHDRVTRQFGMAQHLPEQGLHYRIDIEVGEYAMAIDS